MTYDSYEAAKPFMQTGEEFENTKTLNFIYDRLIEVHGENPKYDYMHKLKNAIIMVEKAESTCNKAALKPRDNDYAMSVMEKKVKVEWDLLCNTNFNVWGLRELLENGELFYSINGEFLSVPVGSCIFAIEHFLSGNIYRRIETEVDERQEFIEAYAEAVGVNWVEIDHTAGVIYDSGKFKLV